MKKKPSIDYKAQCRANYEATGNHYGWFRDTNANDRVERINATAKYTYLYRTDADYKESNG